MLFTRLLSAQALAGGATTLLALTGGHLYIATLGAAACGVALSLLPVVMEPSTGRR